MTTRAIVLGLCCTLTPAVALATSRAPRPLYDEAALRQRYQRWVAELNTTRVATDYPKAVRDLVSGDGEKQASALKTLAATDELEVIPWLVLFLDHPTLRGDAALGIEQVVYHLAIKRRDPSKPGAVVLLPRKPNEPDLEPLTWLALRMFRSNESNLQSAAATLARYLEAKVLERELREALDSPQPAVSRSAWFALDAMHFKDLPPDPTKTKFR